MQAAPANWYLRGRVEKTSEIQSLLIHKSNYVVGRRPDVDLCVRSPAISSRHAELCTQHNRLIVRDLKSTNGTYLNGVPVRDEAPLDEGDLLQFADMAFRICREHATNTNQTLQGAEEILDNAFSLFQFDKLMNQQSVIPYYQPLVELPGRKVFGYEVLGRSKLVGLETPRAMFLAASQLNMESELSRLMRVAGMTNGVALPGRPSLFLNTHPSEVVEFGLLESLRETRANHPDQPLVLELHEAAVTDLDSMRLLRAELDSLHIGMAYDDFGAGQSRLRDIFEVPPDYLKFDMSLVRDIHKASPRRQDMLASLVRSVREMEIVPLAEGVETQEEDEVLCQMGFTAGQGYLYGRPVPAELAAHEALV